MSINKTPLENTIRNAEMYYCALVGDFTNYEGEDVGYQVIDNGWYDRETFTFTVDDLRNLIDAAKTGV